MDTVSKMPWVHLSVAEISIGNDGLGDGIFG